MFTNILVFEAFLTRETFGRDGVSSGNQVFEMVRPVWGCQLERYPPTLSIIFLTVYTYPLYQLHKIVTTT